jgi:hypothetical protein
MKATADNLSRRSRTIAAGPTTTSPESTDCLGEFGVIPYLFCPFPFHVWSTRATGPPNSGEPLSAPL